MPTGERTTTTSRRSRGAAESEASDPGPAPERVPVQPEVVRRLVGQQFPQWSGLSVEPVTDGGWDNWTFHLGDTMVARLPSAAEYAQAVEKEHRWLPVLAPQLPLPVPAPLAKGEPSADYPHHWSIYRWLDGVPATRGRITDDVRFATDLADFLAALQGVDPVDGPQPGVHNWYRGGSLRTWDGSTRRALTELEGIVDVDRAGAVWAQALDSPWDGVDRWFHGDVAAGNLLLDGGRLSAVIDFGTCGVGDPSCDFAVAWTLLTANGRRAFRERLSVDAGSWARGRGWALWKTLVTCAAAGEDPEDAEELASATRVLDAILDDDAGL